MLDLVSGLSVIALIVNGGVPGTPSPTQDHQLQLALLAAASAVVVAFIGGLFSLLISRRNNGPRPPAPPSAPVPKVVAYERFLIRHDYDPRRIRTGYETDEKVRFIDTPPPAP